MTHQVLVTGSNGQLGTELRRASWPSGFVAVAVDRGELDLADPSAIAAIIKAGHNGRPFAAVMNAAAYTAVDKAETDAVTAWAVNALAPAAFGQVCASIGIPLVHVSTDYVFSGKCGNPWRPDDYPSPLGVYGASKLGGELAVRTSGARHVIVRTSWVVSAHGGNFIKTMLRLSETRDVVRVVADQRGNPTSAADLARALVRMATSLVADPGAPTGIFHYANAGPTTWADFAYEIFRQSALRGGPAAVVEPITTAGYPTPARRPCNSVLDLSAIEDGYAIIPRPWQDALSNILDELIGLPMETAA